MHSKTKTAAVALAFILAAGSSLLAQQKGQYVPGQAGLNAGLIPDPEFAYGNTTLNYSASQLNNSSANAVSGISGTYGFWANENFFSYVPHFKVLGGHFAPLVILPFANGSLTAAGPLGIAPFGINAGGAGLADMWVQPINIGWHFSRVDFSAGDGFVAPTGRYGSAPGTTNNVGSGYWGNDVTTGTTIYLTKNKGTTAILFTDWEVHGQKQGTNFTPGNLYRRMGNRTSFSPGTPRSYALSGWGSRVRSMASQRQRRHNPIGHPRKTRAFLLFACDWCAVEPHCSGEGFVFLL